MSENFEQRLQRLAEDHLLACEEAIDSDETPAVGPYCGCHTCVVREVLAVTWEEMRAEATTPRVRAER